MYSVQVEISAVTLIQMKIPACYKLDVQVFTLLHDRIKALKVKQREYLAVHLCSYKQTSTFLWYELDCPATQNNLRKDSQEWAVTISGYFIISRDTVSNLHH